MRQVSLVSLNMVAEPRHEVTTAAARRSSEEEHVNNEAETAAMRRQQVLVNGRWVTVTGDVSADGAQDGSDGRVRQLGCGVEARRSRQERGKVVQTH